MKITKIGHCCLLVEVNGKRIMTDPGAFTVESHVLQGIDVVLFTHEHVDHLHIDSLKEIIAINPEVTVVSNGTVGKILEEAGVSYMTLEGTDSCEINGTYFEAFDAKHEEVFEKIADVHNTGYFITKRFFYPGDAYAKPEKPIEILALPVAGPWCKLNDALQYVLDLRPKIAFPIHDGLLNDDGLDIHHRIVGNVLTSKEIEFRPIRDGYVEEF